MVKAYKDRNGRLHDLETGKFLPADLHEEDVELHFKSFTRTGTPVNQYETLSLSEDAFGLPGIDYSDFMAGGSYVEHSGTRIMQTRRRIPWKWILGHVLYLILCLAAGVVGALVGVKL